VNSPVIEPPLTRLERLDPRYAQCADFLDDEALALDENRLADWLGMLHRDLDYRVPMRLARERAAGVALSDGGFHFYEDYDSIENRVNRLDTEYAWAEDPPARYRRFVTNVRVSSVEGSEDLRVSSNLLLYRERLEYAHPDLLTGRRDDVLRPNGDRLLLVRRRVLLDHTVIAAPNLSMFL
jgi:3-phenylpropionate/cinnamic acid dioxygenase small subunit